MSSISIGSSLELTFNTGRKVGINLPLKEVVQDGDRVLITAADGEAHNLLFSDWGYASAAALYSAMTPLLDEVSASLSKDYKYSVALGSVNGATAWSKFGYNNDIDVGTESVVSWGGLFQRMTTADTLTLVSTSAQDSEAPATGARSVIIYGINENRESQVEVVALDGLAGVVTTNQWLGVNRIAIYLAGSGGVNTGTITATATTAGSTQGEIPAGSGTTEQAIFHTQSGHTLLLDYLLINVLKTSSQNPVVIVRCYVTSGVSGAKYEVLTHRIDTAVENTVELRPSQPFVVGEKSIIDFQCTTDKADTQIAVRFSGIEFEN